MIGWRRTQVDRRTVIGADGESMLAHNGLYRAAFEMFEAQARREGKPTACAWSFADTQARAAVEAHTAGLAKARADRAAIHAEERARIRAILESVQAAEHIDMAMFLALQTDTPAHEAITALGGSAHVQ